MLHKTINFIKYHNAVPISFMVVFTGFSMSLAASSELRENFVSSQDVVRSVDNSFLLNVDMDNFNFALRIQSITEDPDTYYVAYTYTTIAIQDYVWQEVLKENTLTISKAYLGDRDLGLYVVKELGEVLDYELSYLKEVINMEEVTGLTQKVVTTQYAGLIGKLLEPKDKVLDQYIPVVTQRSAESSIGEANVPPSSQESTAAKEIIDREEIRQIVQELLIQHQAQQFLSPTPEPTPEATPESTITEGTSSSSDSSEPSASPTAEPTLIETPAPAPESTPAE